MRTQEKVSILVDLELELSRANDVDLLLKRILTEARRLTGAEAGSIYLKRGDRLEFACTQNEVLQARLAPGRRLVYATCTLPVDEGSLAGYAAKAGAIVRLADVRRPPPGAPYAFRSEVDEATGYRTRSVLTVPLKTTDEKIVGVLQLINARGPDGRIIAFASEDTPFILAFSAGAAIALERAQMTRSMIMRVVEMARMRDPLETGAHVARVADYAVLLYERWASARGASAEQVERDLDVLKIAAMLHDAGKVAVSDAILKKPGRLTLEEVEEMRRHTWLGAGLFADAWSPYDRAAASIAFNHHERWDGGGYPGDVRAEDGTPTGRPGGKRGEEIPPFGRAVAVADVYDALTSRRCYKDPWPEDRVLEAMRAGAGTQFDPDMVDAFFFDLDAVRAVRARHPDAA